MNILDCCMGLALAVLTLLFSATNVYPADTRKEYVTTSPLYIDGVLYVASYEPINGRGHLRALDLLDSYPVALWDAAENMPLAGEIPSQPDEIDVGNHYRFTLTNLNDELAPLDAGQANELMTHLGLDDAREAELLLYAVRGRRGGELSLPAGNREDPNRLWGISRSSPVLVGRSTVNHAARQRDRTIYVGAEDGMLHAFHVSRFNPEDDSYPVHDWNGGREIWAYLPGSFLPYLQNLPVEGTAPEPVIHLDSTPFVGEFFVDHEGDGRRQWRTLLAATGTNSAQRLSTLFVLDITDPLAPLLLWETQLPGDRVGQTRGVNIGKCADRNSECIYLAASFRSTENSAGFHLLSLDLLSGDILWDASRNYPASGPLYEQTPAIPAFIDIDGDQYADSLILGDLAGQLWVFDIGDGQVLGDGPIYTVPGGIAEPIGITVAVDGNTVVFGTGGISGTSNHYQYALYKVEITRDGGLLQWRYPLQVGEKVWETPLLDTEGNIVSAASKGYDYRIQEADMPSGRLVKLNPKGEMVSEKDTGSAVVNRIVSSRDVFIAVALTGETLQCGTASRLSGPSIVAGSVKILSWRQR